MENITDFEKDKQKMINMYFTRNMTIKAIAKELQHYSEKTITRDILDYLDMAIDKYRSNKKYKIKAEQLKAENESTLAYIDRLPYIWDEQSISVGDVKVVKGQLVPKINKLMVC